MQREIPMIPWAKPKLFGNEEIMVVDALRSAWISGGPYLQQLERVAADKMAVAEAIAVSNGTVALELALRGLGIGAGDEVIVPAFTFVAAANMVISVGATPVYADVDADSWLFDPNEIDRLVTARTRAVLPVHLYGNVADMTAIKQRADAHGVVVLEDAAEAAFSRFEGRCAGTIGRVGTFSLHATKTITTGEGGLIVTDDGELAARMRVIRDHGMRQNKRYWHDVVGYNYRLTNLQAAIGCAQLEHLDEIITERRRIHARYRHALEGRENISLQHFSQNVDPVLWAMTASIPVKDDVIATRKRRDAIMAALLEEGIETRPGFYALNLLSPYDCPDLPNARNASAAVVSLPTFFGLADEQIDHISERFLEHVRASGERL